VDRNRYASPPHTISMYKRITPQTIPILGCTAFPGILYEVSGYKIPRILSRQSTFTTQTYIKKLHHTSTPDIHASIYTRHPHQTSTHLSIPDIHTSIPDIKTSIPDIYTRHPHIYTRHLHQTSTHLYQTSIHLYHTSIPDIHTPIPDIKTSIPDLYTRHPHIYTRHLQGGPKVRRQTAATHGGGLEESFEVGKPCPETHRYAPVSTFLERMNVCLAISHSSGQRTRSVMRFSFVSFRLHRVSV